MWDLPGPGLKPVSPTLAGGFLTTAPPGKSPENVFNVASGMFKATHAVRIIFLLNSGDLKVEYSLGEVRRG